MSALLQWVLPDADAMDYLFLGGIGVAIWAVSSFGTEQASWFNSVLLCATVVAILVVIIAKRQLKSPTGKEIVTRLRESVRDANHVRHGLAQLLRFVNLPPAAVLVQNNGTPQAEDAPTTLVHLGGWSLLFQILRNHASDNTIVLPALSVLVVISKSNEVVEEAEGDTSVDYLLGMLDDQVSKSRELVEKQMDDRQANMASRRTVILLGALAGVSIPIRDKIMGGDGVSAVLRTLHWYRKDPVMVQWCCWAFCHLSFGRLIHKEAMVQSGVVTEILTAMRAHPHHAEMQRQALAVMYSCLFGGAMLTEDGQPFDEDKNNNSGSAETKGRIFTGKDDESSGASPFVPEHRRKRSVYARVAKMRDAAFGGGLAEACLIAKAATSSNSNKNGQGSRKKLPEVALWADDLLALAPTGPQGGGGLQDDDDDDDDDGSKRVEELGGEAFSEID